MQRKRVAIRGICSMATAGLIEELSAAYSQAADAKVDFLAVGGVDAARRVASGERFDVVVLASRAIDELIAAGHLDAGKVDVVRSGVGVAVRVGAEQPDIADADSLRRAVRSARRIAYSTGPSGVALMALFQRWGIADELADRLVQAPPGVPVGALVARDEADLGFQQMSELIGISGISLLGPLPTEVQITTIFSGAPVVGSVHLDAVHALLSFMTSADSVVAKQRHGMAPPLS